MKHTVITGASNGIGLELAYEFAKNGHHLVLVARSKEKLKEVSEQIRKQHSVDIRLVSLDLSIADSADELVRQIQGLEIECLVNNAGFGDFGFFHKSDWKKQEQMINLNILTLTHLTHSILPKMVQRGSGYIMNVASTAAFQPGPLMSVYFATKSYVLHFSEALSNELEGTGVSVTVLCPGATESGFQEKASMNASALVKNRSLPSSKSVAQFGYRQMKKKKVVAVHGLANFLMTQSVRVSPRSMVLKVVRMMQNSDQTKEFQN